MAKITATTDGQTVQPGDNDTVRIDVPGGGTVTIEADPGDTVGRITIVFRGDSESDVARVDLSTFSEDGLEINIQKYDPTDQLILDGAYNIRVDPGDPSQMLFDYVGSDNQVHTGVVVGKDGNDPDFSSPSSPIIICFAAGTMIDTDKGPVLVEWLRPGDRVRTRDRGYQTIRWIGTRHLDSVDLARNPHLRPVRISHGALGPHQPQVALTLSPQHRVRISDWQSELYFGADSVLVPVCHLIDGERIQVVTDASSVSYYHLLLDGHEVIFANGLAVESLYLGQSVMDGFEPEVSAEVLQVFPQLKRGGPEPESAARLLRGFEAAVLRVAG